MSDFLGLPPELRNYIYELMIRNELWWFLIVGDESEIIHHRELMRRRSELNKRRVTTVDWPCRDRLLDVICPMVYVCRQTRDEVTPMIAALFPPGLRRMPRTRFVYGHFEEARNLSLEMRLLTDDGKSVKSKVRFGMLPGEHKVVLVFERWEFEHWDFNCVLERKLVAAMRAYLLEKGTDAMVGDFDPERMAALTVAEFRSEHVTSRWYFTLHYKTIECIRRIPDVRQI